MRVPFATPYAFVGPDLFVEWKTTSADTRPALGGWADALVSGKSGDQGIAVTLGQGGCSSLTPAGLPMTHDATIEKVPPTSPWPVFGASLPILRFAW